MINIFLHFNTSFAEYSDFIGFSFGFIEIFRRFIWNYFRLENEHLNNCGQFRAVRDISIRPTIIPNDNLSISQATNSQSLSETIRNNTRTKTTNDYRREQTSSLIRKKTDAKECINEMIDRPGNRKLKS
jgi:hypothetical protein